jgi:hypothetical protein
LVFVSQIWLGSTVIVPVVEAEFKIADTLGCLLLAQARRRRPKKHGVWARVHRSHGARTETELVGRKHLEPSSVSSDAAPNLEQHIFALICEIDTGHMMTEPTGECCCPSSRDRAPCDPLVTFCCESKALSTRYQ